MERPLSIKMRKSLTTTSRPTAIMQGNIQQILEELDWLEKMILEKTPKVSLTKQLFIQFLMDVFHLFEYLQGDDLADVVKKVHDAATFSEMIGFIQEELSRFLSHYRMNENVASVPPSD